MQVTCADCDACYDDALCWTYCPHDQFMTKEVAARKDAAVALLGTRVVFVYAPANEPPRRVQSVAYDGMVTLVGMTGEFAPHLFTVVGAKG